jgi:hypothetical protein
VASASWRRRCGNTRGHRVFLSSPDRSDYMNRMSDTNFKGIAASRLHYEISAWISITSRDGECQYKGTYSIITIRRCMAFAVRVSKNDGMKQRGDNSAGYIRHRSQQVSISSTHGQALKAPFFHAYNAKLSPERNKL